MLSQIMLKKTNNSFIFCLKKYIFIQLFVLFKSAKNKQTKTNLKTKTTWNYVKSTTLQYSVFQI